MNYRFVIRDPGGHHPCIVEMPLQDDDAAIELAHEFITATAYEIWQNSRIVEVVIPQELAGASRRQRFMM